MEQVLMLNQAYEPILVIGWKRAVSMYFLEKVEIIKEYDKEICSANFSMKVPSVIRLLKSFKRYRRKVRFSRTNIIARDNRKCQYCGEKFPLGNLTLDHVIPRSQGGKASWTNLVCCCSSCNIKKGDRTPEEAGMVLKSRPSKPDWAPIFPIMLSFRNIPDTWKDFCYFL